MNTENTSLPLLGEAFPSIKVQTTKGILNLPEDYKGYWMVLFSHPGDFTPVCTTEFVSFSKKEKNFRDLGARLVGLSVDQVTSHLKWVEWIEKEAIKVPFPVIADELGILAKKLGMIHEAKGTNTVRAVFIIDPEGKIRLMMYYPQEIGRNVDEILRALNALQVADKYKVATPENYPNNDWLGKDKVIVPPAKNEAEIEDRKEKVKNGEYECKDWWLCYKDLKK